MESIDTELADRIRADIIHGIYPSNARLSEAHLCEAHKVSRTPVRLALRLLEREGMVKRGDGRGYLVQQVTVDHILEAVQVRGHLESLAARLMALHPDRGQHLSQMARAIETIERLIGTGTLDNQTIREMHAANVVFHNTILSACGNSHVGFTCGQISHLPMLAPGSMVFDQHVLSSAEGVERSIFRLRLGNSQHQVIFDAIERGDPVRAEGMMREHSNTMIEYIETFETRNSKLTVTDLVSYSAADITVPHPKVDNKH